MISGFPPPSRSPNTPEEYPWFSGAHTRALFILAPARSYCKKPTLRLLAGSSLKID